MRALTRILPAALFLWCLIVSCVIAPCLTVSDQASAMSVSEHAAHTAAWNALLAKHVQPHGGVDYLGFEKDHAALESFLNSHASLALAGADDNTKKAIYINLYNAAMIYNLLRYAKTEKISVSSSDFLKLEINDIRVPGGNIWNGRYTVRLAGQDVTLDDIEHGLIRGQGAKELEALKVNALDPRIHAAVNCAALSCPRLREVAYTPATVDAMLDENLREFVSSPAQFVKKDETTMQANSIVYWYYADFDDYGQSLGKGGAGGYLADFLAPEAPDREWKIKHFKTHFNDRGKISLKLSSAFSFYYDWHVNDVRNRK